MRLTPLRAVALTAAVLTAAGAVTYAAGPAGVTASIETEALFDDQAGGFADGDDPAIWVHPRATERSLVLATAKDAGLRVYDVNGRRVQTIATAPATATARSGRFNNVDIVSGHRLGGDVGDLAVVSDRGRDRLMIYAIDKGWDRDDAPLRNVTANDAPLVFSADAAEVQDQRTAYGIAAWVDRASGTPLVAVSRRNATDLALFRLVRHGTRVSYERVDAIALPSTFTLPGGTQWSPCEEPGEGPQVEGMVADAERGVLFMAQEDVGIWRVSVGGGRFAGQPVAVDRVREFGVPATFDPVEEECVVSGADPGLGGHLAADAEGLTIYQAAGERGYLLASSQGDDGFAVYDRRGLGGFLGRFTVGDGAVDGVQGSDGAAVTNVAIGARFPKGLLVVHDGANTPEVADGDEPRDNTNFKFVPWERVAASLSPGLRVDPVRRPGDVRDVRGVRFATFNASLNRGAAGQLVSDLSTPDNAQAKAVAEVIQRSRPDVLLINEFDFDEGNPGVDLFARNYLEVGQNGAEPVSYPYRYAAPSNTGVPSGFDLDNNGQVGGGNDAFGFGLYPGQFGMAVYSKYPIDTRRVRTFQRFLWRDMPGALLPDDPGTPAPNDWYSADELAAFRLSSKSHWDLPIRTPDGTVHVLVSHPTPPVFDGPEDRNGTRNHDEIRLWADYVSPGKGSYIVDDAGQRGGLQRGARFVIAGDQNADPLDGDSVAGAIQQLLESPRINSDGIPSSPGGDEQSRLQGRANATHRSNPSFDTADFADGAPGNLRVDYVLPDRRSAVIDSAVFWPHTTDPLFRLPGLFPFPTSDHRLVWVDVARETG